MSAVDVIEVTQTILREREGRDRGLWQQMLDAFAPEASVRLSWYRGDAAGFVAGSERMSGSGDPAVHRLSPPVVHARGDRATAEVSSAVELQVRIDDVPAHLISYTRLNYRLERRDGAWVIVQMDAVYERDTLTPAIPGDQVRVSRSSVLDARPSYALLSFYLASKGYDIRDDLLGDDRPAAVADFYADMRAWLEGQDPDAHE
ncbi:nuclear transport factor 2 family protein [Microbacterium sp. E-13]|uniref:nuclear transport factor 2 family protein n=1 Tax=Microbacterium sp. E-13 TaxID=3404048 RepID=UPI003CF5BE69